MGFTRFTKNVLNVSALPDRVQNQASTLKATFDQAGVDIKAALNALIAELEAATSANNIGADVTSVTTKTVQAILAAFEERIADRYTKTETETLVANDTNNLVSDVDVNLTTGVITITKKDGTTATFDTALEKVPAKFEIVENGDTYALKITNQDGTVTQADITQFMNVYNFNNSAEVAFEVNGAGNEKTVTASIRANSIGLDKLSLSIVSTLEGYMTSAKDSAAAAKTSETNARTSELNAQTAANTALNKASEATTAANTATSKASAAEKSAEDAEYWAKKAQESGGGGGGGITEIPIATKDRLGGIKVGANLTITSDGTLNAEAGGGTVTGETALRRFVGTQENPIDFTGLFENMGNAADGWYQGSVIGTCVLNGYVKTQNGVQTLAAVLFNAPGLVDDIVVNFMYQYFQGAYEAPIISCTWLATEPTMLGFTAMAGQGIVSFDGEVDLATENYVDNAVLKGSGLSSNPIGTIIPYMGTTAPKGYLVCDGSEKNIADYSDLARFFELQFGSSNHFGGNGSTTFAVPDLRNEFLRGHGDLSGEIGEHQNATTMPNTYLSNLGKSVYYPKYNAAGLNGRHQTTDADTEIMAQDEGSDSSKYSVTILNGTIQSNANYGTLVESYTARPTNVAVLYCIKYTVSMEGLEVDATPTEGSLNAVSSGGVKDYVDGKLSYGAEDLEAGTSELATGKVYFVYE